MSRRSAFYKISASGFLIITGLFAGCSLEKKSAVNRGLQNLTAHYNILFNANETLKQKQELYASSFVDNYNQVLRVYQDTIYHTDAADKELASVISRANTIINIKEQSHYIGDAYILLAKANYFYGNYFNSDEYCSYVIRSWPDKPKLVQEARSWRVRTLLNLRQLPLAKAISDTALLYLTEDKKKKTDPAEVYAARLQYDIDAHDYAEGETMAKQAIKAVSDARLRRRITFILAQLQELEHKPDQAYLNYSKIVGSNAPFEMAFNAELNRIRIADVQNNRHVSRIDRLRGLLRNENNKDFTDQIYYQIAELQLAEGKVDDAVKNYRLSIKSSTKNQNQKGLSYLRLADINFKNKGDYIGAKKLYDSTLINLLPNYPGYRAIQLKANNLQLLAEQLRTIGHEDTLQQLAALPEKERNNQLDAMVKQRIANQHAVTVAATNSAFANANGPNVQAQTATTPSSSTFYFYNVNAVSQGYADFIRRWGNRKLEDNWRRANRPNSDITNNTQNTSTQIDPAVLPQNQQKSNDQVLANNYRQEIMATLPLTPQSLAQSNTRVYNAYFTIANFYRDILEDPKEAINAYELLLKRFPNSTEKPAIYYNLYRLYSNVDQPKSDYYKNLLLKDYPETPFSKVITDPEYAQHINDQDAEFNAFYNQLYDMYARKQYPDVIKRADELLIQYPNQKLTAQIAYLRALAAGHQEKLLPFRTDLEKILTTYPNDKLIGPLVNEHIAYIDANQAELAARPVVLLENDGFLSPFLLTPAPQQTVIAQAKPQTPAAQPKPAEPAKPQTPAAQANANAPVKVAPALFTTRDSSRYYFVVNVNTGTINLSSSRFGIGQFNRANFDPAAGIKHQLTNAGADNQLIYIGIFHSLTAVKDYARAIIPLMPQIMKVPADKYSFFIITQENLDKLADKKMLDSYIDFYQKNY